MNKAQQVIQELYNMAIANLKLTAQEHFGVKGAFEQAIKVLEEKPLEVPEVKPDA